MPDLEANSPHEYPFEYFQIGILDAFISASDRFTVRTDFFEGRLISNDYEPEPSIDVRFGFRTLSSGELALVAFRYEIHKLSAEQMQQWSGFRIEHPDWKPDDARFDMWRERYLNGDWSIENGPREQIECLLRTINALTTEQVGLTLFKAESFDELNYPTAQNTHRYQDAHGKLYSFLIDGLEKACIKAIAFNAGETIAVDNDKTLSALRKIPNVLADSSVFWTTANHTSEQRRIANHGTRPTSVAFRAFEVFSQDLESWVIGLKELQGSLERQFGISGEMANQRQCAKRLLPKIDPALPPHLHTIQQLMEVVGRTIIKVEFGQQPSRTDVHRGEALILHFDDGGILGLCIGSNAGDLVGRGVLMSSDIFSVSFIPVWVPPCT